MRKEKQPEDSLDDEPRDCSGAWWGGEGAVVEKVG